MCKRLSMLLLFYQFVLYTAVQAIRIEPDRCILFKNRLHVLYLKILLQQCGVDLNPALNDRVALVGIFTARYQHLLECIKSKPDCTVLN